MFLVADTTFIQHTTMMINPQSASGLICFQQFPRAFPDGMGGSDSSNEEALTTRDFGTHIAQ